MHLQNAQSLNTPEQCLDAAVALLQQASRTVRIRSAALDASLFNQRDFNLALSAFARRSRYSHIQILLDDTQSITDYPCETLNLARRLSDKIQIKQFYDEPNLQRDSYIIADQRALLIKAVDPKKPGFYAADDRVSAKHYTQGFEHEWGMSELARHLRNLHIS